MQKSALVLALAVCATPAAAHDFWLQPNDYWVEAGTAAAATLQVGHGPARQRSPIPAERITALRSRGPAGIVDRRPGLRLGRPTEDAEFRFSEAGTHVLALETNNALSNLPAIRFNDYIKAEGLTAAIDWRAQTETSDEPGRELYSRRAKALVQVGPPHGKPQPQVTEPLGLSLEIVPERNPYELQADEKLPVQVLYNAQPLAGALVKLTDLHADEKPVETHVTDAGGQAAFTVPHRGSWLLNVVWTVPLPANRQADSLTTFSSLSFGFPDDAN